MAKKIGIDADQAVGREKAVTHQKAIKAEWMAARMTILVPKTLARDFREECAKRKLTHAGVMRDLMVCWLIANKDGVNADAYRRALQDELKSMEIFAKAARQKQDDKLTGHDKRIAMQEKARAKSNPIHQDDLSLHKENPFDEGDWMFKD